MYPRHLPAFRPSPVRVTASSGCIGTNLAHRAEAPNPVGSASAPERGPARTSACQRALTGRRRVWCEPDGSAWNRMVQLAHFTEIDGMSIVPKAVIFTPVTLSDQPMEVLPYHI